MPKTNHKRVGGGRRKFAPGEKDRLVDQARDLRLKGVATPDIAEQLGISITSVKRWCKGVKPRRTRKAVGTILNRDKKLQQRSDRERNMIDTTTDLDEEGPFVRVTEMPKVLDAYLPYQNDDGEWVMSGKAIAHAHAILTTSIHDEAVGRLLTVPDIELIKANYVLLHVLNIWSYEGFLTHREDWRVAREASDASQKVIAERVGVNEVTISRWETAQRNPDPTYRKKLWMAYRSLIHDTLIGLEGALILQSWADHFRAQYVEEGSRDNIPDAAEWWKSIAPIDEVTHLYQARQLVPKPKWRSDEEENGELEGYFTPDKAKV